MPDYGQMYKDLSNQEGKSFSIGDRHVSDAVLSIISACLAGKFKKIHSRVKNCSESIGFFGGGDREKHMVNERFDKYMEQDWVRNWCNFKYSIVENFFRARVPETLQWALRFTFGAVAGGTGDENDELRIKNDDLCIKNDEFCIQNDCKCRDGRGIPRR